MSPMAARCFRLIRSIRRAYWRSAFTILVNRLVLAEVPLIFVAFPRLVQDADYLVEKLRPLIPSSITPEQARRSHGRTADASLARVGRELNRARERQPVATDPASSMPTLLELDNIALRRELVRLRNELTETEAARLALARSLVWRRLYNRCRRTMRMLILGAL